MTPLCKTLTEALAHYAEGDDRLRAAFLIGSQAREERPSDAFSDVDMVLFVTDIAAFVREDGWLRPLGAVALSFVEHTLAGGQERRVVFESGLDADFILLQTDRAEAFPQLAEVLTRAHKGIVDKDGYTALIDALSAEDRPFVRPSEEEALNLIHTFFFHVLWTGKKALRGETFSAVQCADGYMKQLLLQALQYQAKALHGEDYDVWHDGRFLEKWAEPASLRALGATYAAYEDQDILRSLGAALRLFAEASHDFCEGWGFAYPIQAETFTADWLGRVTKA